MLAWDDETIARMAANAEHRQAWRAEHPPKPLRTRLRELLTYKRLDLGPVAQRYDRWT